MTKALAAIDSILSIDFERDRQESFDLSSNGGKV